MAGASDAPPMTAARPSPSVALRRKRRKFVVGFMGLSIARLCTDLCQIISRLMIPHPHYNQFILEPGKPRLSERVCRAASAAVLPRRVVRNQWLKFREG